MAGNFRGGGLSEVLIYDRTNGQAKFRLTSLSSLAWRARSLPIARTTPLVVAKETSESQVGPVLPPAMYDEVLTGSSREIVLSLRPLRLCVTTETRRAQRNSQTKTLSHRKLHKIEVLCYYDAPILTRKIFPYSSCGISG